MFDFVKYIEANTLRLEVSSRGGGIEIDASEYTKCPGAKMTAYQNYLGGGMLGAVQSSRNFAGNNGDELEDALKRYYHDITNEDAGEWEASDYEANQARAASAY